MATKKAQNDAKPEENKAQPRSDQAVCPNCGCCPVCGALRQGNWYRDWSRRPQPWYPRPYWWNTITYDTTGSTVPYCSCA